MIPPRSASRACPDEAATDVLHHDIELSLQLEPPSLAGRGTVRIKLRCPTTSVDLDAKLNASAPPFLYALAAGRFAEASLELDGLQLRALGPAGVDLTQALAVTAQAYRFVYEKLQVHLPEAVYSQVFVHGDAAQEAAGLALLGASFLDDLRVDPKEDWVFSHELAHQWFAWLVPCADFADFWLNA